MAVLSIPVFTGTISCDPPSILPLITPGVHTFEQRHLGMTIVDDASLPAGITISKLHFELCRGKFGVAPVPGVPDYVLVVQVAGLSLPANDATPPSSGGYLAGYLFESGSSAPLNTIGCAEKNPNYPFTPSSTGIFNPINPVTSLPVTRADLFSAEYGIIFITQNNNTFFAFDPEEIQVTSFNLLVTYDIETKRGSLAFGHAVTVTADQAIAFSVDGATNVHSTSGMVRVFGDLEVSGAMTGGAGISAFLDGLGT